MVKFHSDTTSVTLPFQAKTRRLGQISKLERKQVSLNKNIETIKKQMISLAQHYKVSTNVLDPLRNHLVDVSISLPVSQSGAHLAAAYKYLLGVVACGYRVLVHSSASSLVKSDQKSLLKDQPNSSNPNLIITVIWKSDEVCPQPTMVVSAHDQVPVCGMGNILRFLVRLFANELYEEQGLTSSAIVDSWLDMFSHQFLNGSSKEKAATLRQLNSSLGTKTFLAGDRFTIADLFVFIVLCQSQETKVSSNIQKWMRRCSSIEALNLPGISPQKFLSS